MIRRIVFAWLCRESDKFGLDGIYVEFRGCICLAAFVDEEETARNRTVPREWPQVPCATSPCGERGWSSVAMPVDRS